MLLALTGVETSTLFRDRFRLTAHAGFGVVDLANYDINRLHPDGVLSLWEGHCSR